MASKSARVPRLVSGVDWTSLPLSPLDGFVLSRIDGTATLSVLSDLTNLDIEVVSTMVEQLIELGAAEWARETVSLPRATGRTLTRQSPPAAVAPSPTPSNPSTRNRVRLTKKKRSIRPEGTYVAAQVADEQVDTSRRGSGSTTPRASHTGSMFPPGELDDVSIEEEMKRVADGLAEAFDDPSPDSPPPPEDTSEPRGAPEAEPKVPEAAPQAEPEAQPADRAATPEPSAQPEAEDDDDVDLDLGRRKRINDLYYAIGLLDHYQMLGVDRDAAQPDIRKSYFRLSKVFHPDTMFRKRLGAYKSRMEAIFQRITEAYEVLGKKKSRAEYDRYIQIQDHTRDMERAMEDPDGQSEEIERLGRAAARVEADAAAAESSAAEAEAVAPEAVAESPEADPQPAPRQMSEGARARQRELMAMKLRGAARAAGAPRHRAEPPSRHSGVPAEQEVERRHALRNLASSLQQTAAQTGGLDSVKRHVLAAGRAETDGDLATAVNHLRAAMMVDRGREDLRVEHARLNALIASTMADAYEAQAIYEQGQGKWQAAASSWSRVFEGRSGDANAARNTASALIEAKGDLHKATELAQRAVALEPESTENLRTLARVYIAAGLGLNARRVLQQAAKLDPEDKMVENLLRDLGR